ncbi:MAG TPA: aminomethyl-transferring glycine dehydrogenase subunit GcvPA [Thiobacillaceae bacterium]|nr:aminomethyl-transferring glycine dehydrogenase subunit GcvPA [Thiobacillaceae bacterium]HNU63936.1 aminomethyl-transferring glycine dehydrogenase subunit GcvPA [Thiobacillaceae bacterium]
MPFIPHTATDVARMLESIGVPGIDALFDEIPPELNCGGLKGVPAGLSEMAVSRLMHERAARDGFYSNFIGAGAYEHHIPAAVWQIVTRGEFYSAYTPYQAEASQGTLQLLYEYQTMMASLTGLDVSNASLYDGASAVAEAILMAVRAGRHGVKRVLVPATLHPRYRAVAKATVRNQGIELVNVPFDPAKGYTDLPALEAMASTPAAALVIPQPNFFGVLEPVDALTDWAHAHDMLAIAVVNPLALALLKPPGQWGGRGADICVGDGQPLGVPLSSGGPYFGFITARQALVRQLPGRIVGRTVDADGRSGFTLTLQAREQHIRRAKATSNICSNQGLLVTAATLHMALLGPQGLKNVALASHANTRDLSQRLAIIPGVERVFPAPFFHEVVMRVSSPVPDVLRALRARGILGGYALRQDYPELADCILVCATETKTDDDLENYAQQLARILSRRREAPPCAYK